MDPLAAVVAPRKGQRFGDLFSGGRAEAGWGRPGHWLGTTGPLPPMSLSENERLRTWRGDSRLRLGKPQAIALWRRSLVGSLSGPRAALGGVHKSEESAMD